MRINVQKRSRRLETISEGDILVFNNEREEVVRVVNPKTDGLYTERIVETRDKNYPIKKEFVAYTPVQRVYPTSSGKVYNWIKGRNLECLKQ